MPHRVPDGTVEEIRIMRSMGYSQKDLCRLYEMSEAAVWRMIHGLSYKTAGGPVEAVRTVVALTRQDARHGDMTMYARGCRCDPCREANRERCRAWRKSRSG